MTTWNGMTRVWLLPLGLCAALAACSADTPTASKSSGSSAGAAASSPAWVAPAAAGQSAPAAPAALSGNGSGSGGAGSPSVAQQVPAADGCSEHQTWKPEGCPCRAGETAACWTGSVADRNSGACHDGLQICNGGSEFASWGPCTGEQKACGTDAGVPPPPDEDCKCVPGAVIQCSEDCTVGIICSLTATKTCLPDGTWSTCREDLGVELDLPGVQCRNMLHGCLNVLTPDMPASSDGELYVGDCSKQFKCGHAPPPVNPPQEQPDAPH
jgi:hypothetical protein